MNAPAKILIALNLMILTSSCVSYQSLVNFNEPPGIPAQGQDISNYQPVTIQPNDILQVQISSTDALSVQPFATFHGTAGEPAGGPGNFLVNSRGEINFPTLGRIKLKGLEMEMAADTILALLRPYFEQDPIVDVRLTNFRINVNGEVNSPGIYPVQNERVTIIDALSMAGDMTSYSRRDSILIIREREDRRIFGYINLNSSNAFLSPYFYLQQNDVVYVQPDKTKANAVRDPASRFLPWVSVVASLTAVVVSIIRVR